MVLRVSCERQTLDGYVHRYKRGESIESIALSVCFSPYHLARLILGRVLGVPRERVSRYVKDTQRITDARLRNEV